MSVKQGEGVPTPAKQHALKAAKRDAAKAKASGHGHAWEAHAHARDRVVQTSFEEYRAQYHLFRVYLFFA